MHTTTDQADLAHQEARARDLLGNGQPLEALRCGIGEHMAGEFERVPLHHREGMARYVLWGIKPGSFLTAVLCNDLYGALARMDVGAENLWQLAFTLARAAPADSYGSVTAVREWCASGGVFGRARNSDSKE